MPASNICQLTMLSHSIKVRSHLEEGRCFMQMGRRVSHAPLVKFKGKLGYSECSQPP